MVHAGVCGESVSYTARSDSNFRFADNSSRIGRLLKRNSIRKSPFAFLSTQMVEKEELNEEDRPL
jgi:hypothetical protein